MSTATIAAATRGVAAARTFDWTMTVLAAWFQFGAFLDVWAHVHRPEMESFFTPWHAVLYSGFGACAGVLVATALVHRRPGMRLRDAVPTGYGAALVGAGVFAIGGVLDMVWHTVFGIEVDVEALLSPSHLVLAVGSTLIFASPLAAAWRRDDAAGWPAVLSLAFLLSSFAFWTQYAHPLARPWAALGNQPTTTFFAVRSPDPLIRGEAIRSAFVAHGSGIAAILLQAALLSTLVLIVVRRWKGRLPAGAFCVVFTVNATLVGFTRDELVFVPFAAAAGLVLDVVLARLRSSLADPGVFRVFAFLPGAIYYACYFAGVASTKSLWWSVHLWSGAIVLAGVMGVLASYAIRPPAGPPPRERT
jgi:hypothetical protein